MQLPTHLGDTLITTEPRSSYGSARSISKINARCVPVEASPLWLFLFPSA